MTGAHRCITLRSWRYLVFPGLCLGLVHSACGDGDQRAEARDRAASLSCQYFAKCNEIGPGRRYDSMDSCYVQVRGFWENQWSPSACPKVDGVKMSECHGAIQATSCGSGLDLLDTLAKCQSSQVCTAR